MPNGPVIRRIERERPPSFDEQLWPVNLAILVLAGFVQGIIIARLPFANPPNLVQNGWTWTITVATTLLVGLWFVARLDSQRIRRRAQLATVVSLFFHALIFVLVNHDYLLPLPPDEVRHEESVAFTPPVVLNQYDAASLRQTPQADFERPVETATPQRAEEAPRPRPQPRPVETAIPAAPAAESPRDPVTPRVAQARRPNDNPAIRSEQTARASRTPTPAASPSAQPAAAPQERARAQAPATEIDARAAASRSPSAVAEAPRRVATPPPAANVQPRDVQTPRRAADQRQLVESSPSSPRRQTPARPDSTEPARVESPVGNVAGTPRQTRPDEPAPRAVGERRLPTAAQIATAAEPPTIAPAQPPQISAASGQPTRARPETENIAATTSPGAAANRASASRAQPDAPSAAAPATALAEAPRAVSPDPTPGSSAPTRSFQGLTGEGRSQNFDQGPAAARNPASVASAAARRPTATSQDRSNTGLTASLPATAPRRRAGATIPSAANPAEAIQGSLAAGDPATRRDIDADASAAIERSAARAAVAAESADAGPADIDTGPTQVVSETGQGRPAGGGQPTLGEVNPSRTVQRRRAGGQSSADTASAPAVAQSPPSSATTAGAAPRIASNDSPIARGSSGQSPTVTDNRAATGPATERSVAIAESTTGGRASAQGVGDVEVTQSQPRGARRTARADAVAALPGDLPTVPGDAASAGTPAGVGVDARGTDDARTAVGEIGRSSIAPADAGVGPDTAQVSTGAGSVPDVARRATDSGFDAATATRSVAGGARRRSASIGAISGTATTDDLPGSSATSPTSVGPSESAGESPASSAGRRDGGPQTIAGGPIGPGDSAARPTSQTGPTNRRATPDVATVSPVASRSARRSSVTSPAAVETTARLPSESFGDRRGRRYLDAPAGGPVGSVAKTEDAIEAGLEFLARRQSADGRWSLHEYPGRPRTEAAGGRAIHSDTAATGLALLAFLGAAYDHYGDEYQHVVGRGVKWLLSVQQPDGNLYVSHDRRSDGSALIYSHAIATIALCEAYGMTGDSSLRAPAQKAIDFLVRAQHPDHGGWRYAVKPGDRGYSSDTSVTGWVVMALKSGELAKLQVPKRSYQGVSKWLDIAQADADSSRYKYNPNAALDPSLQRDLARTVTPAMTSVGLLSRLYTGWDREHRSMVAGAKYLAGHPPDIGANQLRDTYYWYYATQVMFHMGGDFWRAWNERLHPLLVDTQLRQGPFAGSWDPQHDVWGAAAGRIYVTAMNLLSLEVYYRHLPLFEDTAR